MSSPATYYQSPYYGAGSLPLNVPGKTLQQAYPPRQYFGPQVSDLSSSPPERPESVSSTGAGMYSAASSNYAGSDYESGGTTSVDLLDYMSDRLSQTYNPLPLEKNMARQAQLSGEMNAKNRELLELQAQAKARLARTRANFAEGMKAVKEVQYDLQWTQKKVDALNARAAQKYPDQYRTARQRYPLPVDV